MTTFINRAGLLVLAAALAACQATATGTVTPTTPGASPSAAPSAIPSAAPSAVASAPSASASAAPASVAPGAAGVVPGAFEGVASFRGAPVSGWKLAVADAASEVAIPTKSAEVVPATDGALVVYLGAATTDAKGGFTLRVANLGDGDALRVTATSPDGQSAVSTYFTATDLEAPADDDAYVLLHAGHHAVDEVSTAMAALQRGPLRAMAGLPKERRRSLLATLRDGTATLKSKFEDAFKQQPELATSDLTKPGSGDEALDKALIGCIDAAGVGPDAAGVVGKSIEAIQNAFMQAGEDKARKPVGETWLLGTSLKISLDGGATKLKLVNARTGKPMSDLKADAVAKAGAERKSTGGGGSAGRPSQAITLRFAGMIGDTAVVTSGQTKADGAPTYTDVGSDAQTVRVMDLRFYVHDIELTDTNNTTYDLQLDANDWQYRDLALIDLDAGTTDGMNAVVTGTVPQGTYKSVTFKLGVPRDLNHVDKSKGSGKQKAPHEILAWDGHNAGMGWDWMLGRKYAKIELGVQAGDVENKLLFHLGGQGASNPTHPDGTVDFNDFEPDRTTLEKPNLASIKVSLDPTKDTIAVDLKDFFANVAVHHGGSFMPVAMDMGGMGGMGFRLLHGAENAADVLIKNLGIGEGAGSQKLFRKQGE